jgi:hypothetical protein
MSISGIISTIKNKCSSIKYRDSRSEFSLFLKRFQGEVVQTPDIVNVSKEDANWFINAYEKIRDDSKDFPITKIYPFFYDRFSEAGCASGHYFHQDLLVAQRLFKLNPRKHLDIGSRIDGFVAHVASFREIEVLDIRPQKAKIRNVQFRRGDLTKGSLGHDFNYDSISSLHAIEHFGLGRYGDNIDSNGHLKAISNIFEMLEAKGTFFLSIPIGMQRIEFNAHRVFGLDYILNVLNGRFDLSEFHFVDDSGDLHENIDTESNLMRESMYGCGIFVLKKKSI